MEADKGEELMLIQILKKDMMKRKGVNLILFLFITIATIFLTSSINNIMIVTSAVDHYMEYANVPDRKKPIMPDLPSTSGPKNAGRASNEAEIPYPVQYLQTNLAQPGMICQIPKK